MRAVVKTEVLLLSLIVASCGGMRVGGAPLVDGGPDSSNPTGSMPDGGSGSNPMHDGSGGSTPESGPRPEPVPEGGGGGSTSEGGPRPEPIPDGGIGGSTSEGGPDSPDLPDGGTGGSTPEAGPDSRDPPDSGTIEPDTCVESPSTPNMQALFKFDESAGPEILNSIPRTFPDGGATANGQIFGAARIPGRFGGALRFGPIGARAEIPMDVPIILNGQITVKLWVRPQRIDAGSQYHLVGNGHGGIATFRISLESGKVVFSVPDITVWRNIVTSTTALSVDRWTYVAVTYDSTHGYVYLDGKEDASSTAIYPLENQYNRLYIGAINTDNFMWEKEFPGEIDELAILSVAQGPADICKGP